MYSVVIPTHRPFAAIQPLLASLDQQILLPEHVFIVVDYVMTRQGYATYLQGCKEYTRLTGRLTVVSNQSDQQFIPGKGVSYVRNYGINKVKTPLVLCVDDDNMFASTMIQSLITHYQEIFQDNTAGVLFPLEEYRQAGRIRFAGYKKFNPWLARPQKISYNITNTTDDTHGQQFFYQTALAPSNCFLMATSLAKKFPFDERIPYVYEDLLFFGKIRQAGYALYMDPYTKTHHMLRKKTKTQDLYVGDPHTAYQKGRNRIVLIKAIGSGYEKAVFFGFSLWGQTGWLLLFIWGRAPLKDKWPITLSLLKGTRDGLFTPL